MTYLSVVIRWNKTEWLRVKFAGHINNDLLGHCVEAAVAAQVRLLVKGELTSDGERRPEVGGLLFFIQFNVDHINYFKKSLI